MINSYNSTNVTNKYNTPSSTLSNTNSNFLNTIIIDTPEYSISLSDIYYYPNLAYIVNTQCNIYLPNIIDNPYYNFITFKIINNISDSISIFSSSNCLIYSTFFNSVSGDTSMSIGGHRISILTSTVNNNNCSWEILIN